MKKSLISILAVIIVSLCGCSNSESASDSYIGLYTDNVEKLSLKDDLTYELKGIESQNVIQGDYYVEDEILYMFSEYTKHEYAIKSGNIYMIYEGNVTNENDILTGELVCKDKSDIPAIYTYSFQGDKVVIKTEFADMHHEDDSTYKVINENIEIGEDVVLEKDGDKYLRLLYSKVK